MRRRGVGLEWMCRETGSCLNIWPNCPIYLVKASRLRLIFIDLETLSSRCSYFASASRAHGMRGHVDCGPAGKGP